MAAPTLTKQEREAIITDRQAGLSLSKIAAKYGVSKNTVVYHCRGYRPRRPPDGRASWHEHTHPLEVREAAVTRYYGGVGGAKVGAELGVSDQTIREWATASPQQPPPGRFPNNKRGTGCAVVPTTVHLFPDQVAWLNSLSPHPKLFSGILRAVISGAMQGKFSWRLSVPRSVKTIPRTVRQARPLRAEHSKRRRIYWEMRDRRRRTWPDA